MSNKRKGIFIAILVVQLALPVVMCAVALFNQLMFDFKAQEINVLLDGVYYNGGSEEQIEISIPTDAVYKGYSNYWAFYPDVENDGFYEVCKGRNLNNNNLYYLEEYPYTERLVFYYDLKDDGTGALDFLPRRLYDKENEEWNLSKGHFTGNPTQAYATFKVRNGKCELLGVYICGYEINEFISRYQNGEFTLDVYAYKIGTFTTGNGENVPIPEYDMNEATAPYTSDEYGNY